MREWYEQRTAHLPGAPSLERVLGFAQHQRERLLPDLTQDELMSLVCEAVAECLGAFNIARPPEDGEADRLAVQDRLFYFYARKLTWQLKKYGRFLRGRRGKRGRGRGRLRGPRPYQEGVVRTARQLLVWDAIAQLPERDQEIIFLRYWDDATLTEIAEKAGLGNRARVERALRRIHGQLKRILLNSVADAVVDLLPSGSGKIFPKKARAF